MTTPAERPRPSGRSPQSDDFAKGPRPGEALPDFTLADQHGRAVNVTAERNGERALVVFVRSVGWCPYCRSQVVELQQHLGALAAAGVHPVVVTPDTPEVIRTFTEQNAVTLPVLTDTDSAVIRTFGILNTLIDPDEQYYGIPFPGIYLTDSEGVVEQRHFNREYRVRESVASLLLDLGRTVDVEGNPAARAEAAVTAALGAAELTPYQRTPLFVRIALDAGQHVYGEPVPEGFIATEVRVSGPEGLRIEAARYPLTHPYQIEGLTETFHVVDGEAEIVVPLLWGVPERPEGDVVPIEVEVRYQACTARECFAPVTEHVRLTLPLGVLNRAPRPS